MSATREAYIRGCNIHCGAECHIGVEMRKGDCVDTMSYMLKSFAWDALDSEHEHESIVAHVEERVLQTWPDRAYFIETEKNGCGVQVYQPFGMPRNPVST